MSDGHEVKFWRRVSEGSVHAECSCGWRSPKRSWGGDRIEQDVQEHRSAAGLGGAASVTRPTDG